MAQELTVQNAEETGDTTRAKRGQSWPSSFPNRHPKVSGKFGSNPDRQPALAVSPWTDYRLFHEAQGFQGIKLSTRK